MTRSRSVDLNSNEKIQIDYIDPRSCIGCRIYPDIGSISDYMDFYFDRTNAILNVFGLE